MQAERRRYSGNSSYQFVNQLIKNKDKELLIISPYISNHYTRMLIKEAGRKRIRIITSDSSLGYRDSMLKRLHGGGIGGNLVVALYFAILDAITIYLKFFYISITVALLFVLVLYVTVSRRRKAESNITLKTTGSDFVHEKMYISDSMAIVGSANLTYAGTHKNIEHIEVIRDRCEIEELKRHFNSLWERYQ
jgi:phosphatidylserine/phosphatidylglycerophosphate/cardiolipin synthase-like enzyme